LGLVDLRRLIRGNWAREPGSLLIGIVAPTAIGAITLALVSYATESSSTRAVLSIALALTALGTAFWALRSWMQPVERSTEFGSRSLLRSGPIFAVDLEHEMWRIGPRDRVVIVGPLELVGSVLETMPPVDRLWILTSLPRDRHPDELQSRDIWTLRHTMALVRHIDARVHIEMNPVGGGVVQLSEREVLVSLPEFSRSKSGLPAVWLSLRAEDNRALVEDFTLDLARRWETAEELSPAELEDLDFGRGR
jgi:hypothetical protein